MRFPRMLAVAAVGAIALAACGSSSYGSGSQTANTAATAQAAQTAKVAVTTRNTSLGTVLVDGSGLTLYGLTNDMNGMSSCTGSCASVWPPLTVPSATLPAGLDAKLFSVVARPDGSFQLRAGKWPLYRYAGDAAPGDTNGQGSGGVWFVVAPTGKLIKNAS